MLRAATLEHSPLIHRWLRAGAADGSFETEIADDSAAASLFLATVDGALATGYLRVPGSGGAARPGGARSRVRLQPSGGCASGRIRAVPGGRPDGLRALAHGSRRRGARSRSRPRDDAGAPRDAAGPAHLARPLRPDRGARRDRRRLFRECGFVLCRTTASVVWLVSANASPELLRRIAELPLAG